MGIIAPGETIYATDILAIQNKANAAVPASGLGAAIQSYLSGLPTSDAGLATGALFWNGGFLCKKV